jgi:hypothetical protein
MVSLSSYSPDYFVYLFSILIIVISLKVGDLASKLSFNNCYYYLPLVYDV